MITKSKILNPILCFSLGIVVVLAVIGGRSLFLGQVNKNNDKVLSSEDVVVPTVLPTATPTIIPTNTPTPKPKVIYKPSSTPVPTSPPVPTQIPQVQQQQPQTQTVSIETTCNAVKEQLRTTYYSMYNYDLNSDGNGQWFLSNYYSYCLSHNGDMSGFNFSPPPKP